MAAFNITLEQAQQAGRLAAEITAMQAMSDQIQGAISAGCTLSSMSAGTNVGQLSASLQMTATDTATVLNAVLSVVNSYIAALQAELADIGT